jgi:hypothetical protein
VGYAFGYVNADALIHMFHAANGRITTASGMNHRLLALDPYRQTHVAAHPPRRRHSPTVPVRLYCLPA